MNKILINIQEDIRHDIQLTAFEVSARDKIVCHMLESDMDTSTKSFKKYHDEYKEFFAKHELLKTRVEKEYVVTNSEVITFGGKVNWSLDYTTGLLTIEIPNEIDKTFCKCLGE